MSEDIKKEIEKIFRISSSSEELFDTFRTTIELRIKDVELYKTLLRNKALSVDEIGMYTEKICKEFPEMCYSIYFCTAQILSSISTYGKYHDKAFGYYKKAATSQSSLIEPYLAIVEMYNAELNKPPFEEVVQTLQEGIQTVNLKSRLCFTLVDLFKSRGNEEMVKSFQILGDLYKREGK